ncbi:MAG: cation:proton antiporter family protein [Candidatus Competibacteraceae bacterium]|nr:cation:proton antiporter family protein [Candidatus Competibacteraceae bacterium]
MQVLWIAFAFIAGLAVRPLGLPPMVGYLAAGFLLNAFGFAGEGELLEGVAHLGVLLLMFSIGLKLHLKNVLRPEVWGSALVHLTITAALITPGLVWLTGLTWGTAGVLAVTLGFSSTVMAAKVLEAKQELRAFHGRVAIGILIIQDLVAVALLSLSGGHVPSPWALLLLAAPLAQPLLVKLVERSGHDELLLMCGLFLAVAVGGGFEALGLSSELGALVAGAMLASHPKSHELSHQLWSIKELLLVGFFLQIGLAGWPSPADLGVALVLMVLLPLKGLLFFAILVIFRLRSRSAFLASLSLSSYSEFALIVMALAVEGGWLAESWLVTLALAIALSFALVTPINRKAHDLYARYEQRLLALEGPYHHPDEQPISLGDVHVMIMGMGRSGTAAYDFMIQRHEKVVGLDSDPAKVEYHAKEGRRVLFADAEDPGFWQNLRLEGLEAVMLMMPDPEADRISAQQLRQRGFTGLIGATCRYPEEEGDLAAAGADLTFNYYDEVGVGFAEHIWEALYPRLAPRREGA